MIKRFVKHVDGSGHGDKSVIIGAAEMRSVKPIIMENGFAENMVALELPMIASTCNVADKVLVLLGHGCAVNIIRMAIV